jgi:CRP/FNR family transcriptional regulator
LKQFNSFYDALNINEPELIQQIETFATLEIVNQNTFVLEPEKYIKWLAIVLKGKVRVWQENEDREILLYYVEPVQTCVLSLAATFSDFKSSIYAKTTEKTTLLKIPVRFVSQWSKQYPSWHQFTTNTFIQSYQDLLNTYSSLAFKKIKERLIDYLTEQGRVSNSTSISISHQALAREMGTTREVISKTLKKLEQEKKLQLAFKKIELKS